MSQQKTPSKGTAKLWKKRFCSEDTVLIRVLKQARLPYLPHLLWVTHPTEEERRQWGSSPSRAEKWKRKDQALKGSWTARWWQLLQRGKLLQQATTSWCSSPHYSLHPLPAQARRAAQAKTADHRLPIPRQTWQEATGWWTRQWPALPRPRAGSGLGWLLESKYRHLNTSN